MYNADYKILAKYRGFLTKQEIRTLRGQIKAGNVEAAKKGLEKLIRRRFVARAQKEAGTLESKPMLDHQGGTSLEARP